MRTDLPPEAFTKETLQEAFQWLQQQSETVKATIHTPERLVSLYRKSQRLDQNNDAPVSSKKFIDELKSLASSLDEFSSQPTKKTSVSFEQTSSKKATFVTPSLPPIPKESPALDSVTLERVAQVQKRFNLSSENEAIRLLISLGFEKFSQFN